MPQRYQPQKRAVSAEIISNISFHFFIMQFLFNSPQASDLQLLRYCLSGNQSDSNCSYSFDIFHGKDKQIIINKKIKCFSLNESPEDVLCFHYLKE
jgi:hypothetical protein